MSNVSIKCGKLSKFLNNKRNTLLSLSSEDIKEINIESNEFKVLFEHNEDIQFVSDVFLSKDDKYIAIINYLQGLSLWDLEKCTLIKSFDSPSYSKADFTKDSKKIIYGNADKLSYWDIENNSLIKEVELNLNPEFTLSVKLNNENNNLLVYYSTESSLELCLIDIPSFDIIEKVTILEDCYYESDFYHGDPVLNAEFNFYNNNEILISRPEFSNLLTFNINTKDFGEKVIFDSEEVKSIEFFAPSIDKSKLLILSSNPFLAIYDLKEEKLIFEENEYSSMENGNYFASMNRDNSRIAFSAHLFEDSESLQMEIYDITSKEYNKKYY